MWFQLYAVHPERFNKYYDFGELPHQSPHNFPTRLMSQEINVHASISWVLFKLHYVGFGCADCGNLGCNTSSVTLVITNKTRIVIIHGFACMWHTWLPNLEKKFRLKMFETLFCFIQFMQQGLVMLLMYFSLGYSIVVHCWTECTKSKIKTNIFKFSHVEYHMSDFWFSVKLE